MENGVSESPSIKASALIDVVVFLAVTAGLLFIDRAFVPPGLLQGLLLIVGAFVTVWVLVRRRKQRLADLGLSRPNRLLSIPLWFIAIFVTTFAVAGGGQLLVMKFVDASVDLSRFAVLHQNVTMLVVSLITVWVTAAFFEEIVYRGFLLDRLLTISGPGWINAVFMSLLHAVLFGLLHFYQGPLGVITTGLVGFVFGLFYVAQQRNLWALILVHGTIDTINVVQFYLVGIPQTN